MYFKLSLVFFIFLLFSCKTKEKNIGEIEIELGDNMFTRLKGTYLYLYDSSSDFIIDSVLITKKSVFFKPSLNTNTSPILVKVKLWDFRNGNKYLLPLGFKYKSPKMVYTHFYIDESKTFIKAHDILNNDTSFFEGSSQNIPRFLNITLRYPENDSIENLSTHKYNIELIQQYPNSLFLLSQLYYYKEYFPKTELRNLLKQFNQKVKFFDFYTRIENYLSDPIGFDQKYPSFIPFENIEGKKEFLDTTIGNLHLIVFWASWCGPCRKEIPELLKLYNKYSKKGFKITSISIDTDRKMWETALTQEKMPWKQMLVHFDSKQLLDKNYAINTIPKSYLFDDNNKLITSFKGFDSSVAGKLKRLVEEKE